MDPDIPPGEVPLRENERPLESRKGFPAIAQRIAQRRRLVAIKAGYLLPTCAPGIRSTATNRTADLPARAPEPREKSRVCRSEIRWSLGCRRDAATPDSAVIPTAPSASSRGTWPASPSIPSSPSASWPRPPPSSPALAASAILASASPSPFQKETGRGFWCGPLVRFVSPPTDPITMPSLRC